LTELTPEEKRRIYEEEKVRLEAQEKLRSKFGEKATPAKSAKKKTSPATWGCLILIIIVVIVFISIFNETSKESGSSAPSTPKEEIKLNAAVRFTGTQFVIQNNNDFAWTNVKLEINPGILKSGFTYKALRIEPNTTYTVGAMQFSKSDGTRFNPFSIKPKEIFISADTPKGRAYYSGGWE